MLQFMTERARQARGLLGILAVTATLLWLGGAAAGAWGHIAAGLLLRCAAILLLLLIAARRPSLLAWTFLCMLAGVELGIDAPQFATHTRFLGDLFLRLIRMIVAPLLFATITTGIASHSQLRSVGRVAVKALIYFEVVTTLGLIVGAVTMNLSGAGWGVALPRAGEGAFPQQSGLDWQQTILNYFPENIAQAVAQNQILQVAVFSIIFGTGLAMLAEEKRAPMLAILQSLADTMFQITRIVMYLAPLAAGAALAYTVGSHGLTMLLPLGKLVFTSYAAFAIFCVLILLPILLLFRIPVRGFVSAVSEPAAIGFATTTSEAALPLAMERMEAFGVPRWIVAFVMPAAYSFNLTGSSIYLAMASIFAAQASGIHLNLAQQITMLLTLALASKGVAGVPRAVLVVLLATASAIHISTAPILLILGVDALIDMGRTLMNVVGNCLACAVIARSEGEFSFRQQD
jgi:proton glutamate symport protein